MLEGEGNVRPQGPNFLGLPCLHRDTVTSCSLPFGCLGVIAYRPSMAGWIWLGGAVEAGAELPSCDVGSACCWAGSQSGGGELLRGIPCSIWPVSGYLALGCLGGKAVCVVGGIGGADSLASAFYVGTLLEQNTSLVSVLGSLMFDF